MDGGEAPEEEDDTGVSTVGGAGGDRLKICLWYTFLYVVEAAKVVVEDRRRRAKLLWR